MKGTVEIILKQTYREKAFGNCTPGKTGKKQYPKNQSRIGTVKDLLAE
jgi:hypothetical protein